MKHQIILCACLLGSGLSPAAFGQKPSSSEQEIRRVLEFQTTAWNAGNIERFMEGYWKSDSLLFIGHEVSSGWEATLNRYKKSYPGSKAMGSLRFELIRFFPVSRDACLVTGKYFLTREKDNPSGVFTLLFMRKKGTWVIVYDHTS
jgi:hypothetical protein